jgi:hypothetical protein
MASVFADGETCGSAVVRHVTVTKHDAQRSGLIALFSSAGRGSVHPGTYAQLFVGGVLWMSDTPDERRDHAWALQQARGDVLIGGLGLGMVALGCALKENVDSVTVLETNQDVIGLVVPKLRSALAEAGKDPDKLNVICADAFKWKPQRGQLFDCIWMDIWPTLCTDDLREHSTLNRRYAHWKRAGGWSDCWCHSLLLRIRRQDQREIRMWHVR